MKKKNLNSGLPRVPLWLLQVMADQAYNIPAMGDLEELYRDIVVDNNKFFAYLWIWRQVLRSIPLFVFHTLFWRTIMLINYIKMAIRNISSHKGYSFINISGLAIGLAASFLILLFVLNELSYDRFFPNADRIYRIVRKHKTSGRTLINSGITLAAKLKDTFPEISNIARVTTGDVLIKKENNFIHEANLGRADQELFEILDLPMVNGNPKTSLIDPNSIVLTEKMANKYFGDSDPIGKIVSLRSKRGTKYDDTIHELTVTGVLKDHPPNSHFRFDFIIPMETIKWGYENIDLTKARPSYSCSNYLLLSETANPQNLEQKFPAFLETTYSKDYSNDLLLQPLKDIHFNRFGVESDFADHGNPKQTYLFALIALLILLIAIINYVILSTARSITRSKEIGIRKVVGAHRSDLILQIMSESILVCLLALPISLILAGLTLPVINRLLSSHLEIFSLFDPLFIFGLIAITMVTGLVSGSYISFYLSTFRPIEILHGNNTSGKFRSRLRSILIVFQLTIFISLLISSVVIYRQVQFINDGKDLGFNKENVISIIVPDRNFSSRYLNFKKNILMNPGIQYVSASYTHPPANNMNRTIYTKRIPSKTGKTYWFSQGSSTWEKKPDSEIFETSSVDVDFVKTLGLELVEGRGFSADIPSDRRAIVVNESLSQIYQKEQRFGEIIKYFTLLAIFMAASVYTD